MAKTAAGGKSKKYDRNRKWCEAYRLAGTRQINKAVKLAKHCAAHPEDKAALSTLEVLCGPSQLRIARRKITGTSERAKAAYALLGGDANDRAAA